MRMVEGRLGLLATNEQKAFAKKKMNRRLLIKKLKKKKIQTGG